MPGPRTGMGARVVIGVGVALSILGLGVVALLDPLYIHAALDSAGSAGILGMTASATHAMSDRTMAELVFGPATFAFPVAPGGPRFYDAAEAAHLRDASNLLHWFLAVVGVGAVALVVTLVPRRRDPGAWHAVRGGAVALAAAFCAIGLFFAVAFDAAFTLFHEIFFPQGNWEFNVATERMVQLYPTPFWELITMTLAAVILLLCAAAWFVATVRLRSLGRSEVSRAATAVTRAPGP